MAWHVGGFSQVGKQEIDYCSGKYVTTLQFIDPRHGKQWTTAADYLNGLPQIRELCDVPLRLLPDVGGEPLRVHLQLLNPLIAQHQLLAQLAVLQLQR
jgi:hypothetical protein